MEQVSKWTKYWKCNKCGYWDEDETDALCPNCGYEDCWDSVIGREVKTLHEKEYEQ